MYQTAQSKEPKGTSIPGQGPCLRSAAAPVCGQSLKVCTVGAPEFQVAISEETPEPPLKSTRSQPAADHVWTENPAAGVAATSCTDAAATSSVT